MFVGKYIPLILHTNEYQNIHNIRVGNIGVESDVHCIWLELEN